MRYARASASSSPRWDSDSADLADSVAPFTSALRRARVSLAMGVAAAAC